MMKKQIKSLKELYSIAKGKPASCSEKDQTEEATEQKEAISQCCENKNEGKCC